MKKKLKLRLKAKERKQTIFSFQDVVENMLNGEPGIYQNISDLAHFIYTNEYEEVLTVYLYGGTNNIIGNAVPLEDYEDLEFRKFNGRLEFSIG